MDKIIERYTVEKILDVIDGYRDEYELGSCEYNCLDELHDIIRSL